MSTVQKGNQIKVHYTGTFDNGEKFDSSYDRNEPIEFTVGAGQMIPGFDQAVEGMAIDEEKKVRLESKDAYGEKNPELMIPFPKSNMPADMNPKVGDQLTLQNPQGQPVPVVVAEVQEENLILDANHPMAGQDLNFEIKIVSIA